MPAEEISLSPLAEDARTLYETRLKALLGPDHTGQAVAIHVDTGDHAVAGTHRDAALTLLSRHAPDGRIVTLTIGPPTDADLRLTARLTAGPKHNPLLGVTRLEGCRLKMGLYEGAQVTTRVPE